MTGVVVKVNEHDLGVMGENGDFDLYWVSFGEEGNIGFKQGQEILIYYNGIVEETFPARPSGVTKIEIIKEKSNKQIPDNVLNFFYDNSQDIPITIQIKDSTLTPKGTTIIMKNNTDKEYCYEPVYYLEKKENGNWEKIELDEPLSWNTVIFTLNAGEEIETNIREKNSPSSIGFEIHTEFEIKD